MKTYSICELGYLDTLPPVQLSINGLWLADTSYYYPEDRDISENVEFGRKMTKAASTPYVTRTMPTAAR